MNPSSQPRPGIGQLPNEILSSIFLNAVDFVNYEDAFFPIILSQVSSQWRKVSVSTASLWTSIHMWLPHRDTDLSIQNQVAYLQTWVTRSNSLALDIYFDFRDPEWDWNEKNHRFMPTSISHILSIIIPHANRWKHVQLLTDTWAPIHTFLTLTAGIQNSLEALGLLESLVLSRCNAYFARKGEIFKPISLREHVTLFGGARLPSLRKLSLSGVHVDWRSCSFTNLVELDLNFHAFDVVPAIDEFRDIINANPELKKLSIMGWGLKLNPTGGTPVNILPRVILMQKLTKLCFGFVDIVHATRVLSLFNLPSLQELELEDVAAIVDVMGSSDSSALLAFLVEVSSTACTVDSCFYPLHQVKTLELSSIRSNSEGCFAIFFQCFYSLENLHLTDVDSTLLSSLGPRQSSSALHTHHLLPQLVNLVCRRVDEDTLSTIISARALATASRSELRPLQSLQIEQNEDSDGRDDL